MSLRNIDLDLIVWTPRNRHPVNPATIETTRTTIERSRCSTGPKKRRKSSHASAAAMQQVKDKTRRATTVRGRKGPVSKYSKSREIIGMPRRIMACNPLHSDIDAVPGSDAESDAESESNPNPMPCNSVEQDGTQHAYNSVCKRSKIIKFKFQNERKRAAFLALAVKQQKRNVKTENDTNGGAQDMRQESQALPVNQSCSRGAPAPLQWQTTMPYPSPIQTPAYATTPPAFCRYRFSPEPEGRFKCPVIGCHKTYTTSGGLTYHSKHGHRNHKLQTNEDGSLFIKTEDYDIEKEKPYQCQVCGRRYKNSNGIKYHRNKSKFALNKRCGVVVVASSTSPYPVSPSSAAAIPDGIGTMLYAADIRNRQIEEGGGVRKLIPPPRPNIKKAVSVAHENREPVLVRAAVLVALRPNAERRLQAVQDAHDSLIETSNSILEIVEESTGSTTGDASL